MGVPFTMGLGGGRAGQCWGGDCSVLCQWDCLNAHTVSLLSSSPPHAATAAAAFSSQASLSHSWIFAVASEFVCSSPGPGLLGPYQGLWGPGCFPSAP